MHYVNLLEGAQGLILRVVWRRSQVKVRQIILLGSSPVGIAQLWECHSLSSNNDHMRLQIVSFHLIGGTVVHRCAAAKIEQKWPNILSLHFLECVSRFSQQALKHYVYQSQMQFSITNYTQVADKYRFHDDETSKNCRPLLLQDIA